MEKYPYETLIVDLDNTLIKTDLLVESYLQVIKKNPFIVLLTPWLILKGRVYFKNYLSNRVDLNYELLPFRDTVISIINEHKKEGKEVVLATAASEKFAKGVFKHLGFFDSLLSSTDVRNMKGETKLGEIKKLSKSFAYIGDSVEDIKVWKGAEKAYAINPSQKVKSSLKSSGLEHEIIKDKKNLFKVIIRAIRVHQWSKNTLIFLPLIVGQQYTNFFKLIEGVLAFFSFSFAASSVYILNDLLDLDSDRGHHRKKLRPFANGDLALPIGFLLIPVLLSSSFLIAGVLSTKFFIFLSAYLVITTVYSFKFKSILFIDVITLGTLFTMRIYSGGAAYDVKISGWFGIFSLFFFLGLATVKRFTEIQTKKEEGKKVSGRGYSSTDLEMVRSLGTASSMLSVLVFCLYLFDPRTNSLYKTPQMLFLIVPGLIYWIGRFWLLAGRNELHDDPVVFALKDKISYLFAIYALILILLGKNYHVTSIF